MAVMTEENKIVFGALFKLRSLETYVKRLKPAIKKDDKGIAPKEKNYIVAHINEITRQLKASLQGNNMKLKNTLEEAKFAVEVEDIGTVIVDGSSEGEVKARVAKKLKGGKEMIKGVRKITKDKAGKASKALGEELPLYSDYAKTHKED